MKKILFGSLTWLAALAMLAAPAGAKPPPQPPMPQQVSYAADETEVEVHNFNQGMVLNCIDAKSMTGGNFVFGQDAMVDSGDASVGAKVATGLNSSSTGVAVIDNEIGPIALNLGFGLFDFDAEAQGLGGGGPGGRCNSPIPCWIRPSRGPVAVATDKTEVEVVNFNRGFVLTNLDLDAKTGHNFAFGQGTYIGTGDAKVDAAVATTLNSSSTTVAVADGGVGPIAANIDIPSATPPGCVAGVAGGSCGASVGPVAVNVDTPGTAVATKETGVEVVNKNDGIVITHEDLNADTGGNVAIGCSACPSPTPTCTLLCGGATQVAPTTQVVSGDASVTTSVDTTVNSNTTVVTVTK